MPTTAARTRKSFLSVARYWAPPPWVIQGATDRERPEQGRSLVYGELPMNLTFYRVSRFEATCFFCKIVKYKDTVAPVTSTVREDT
jgi:hypothetical protein